MMFKRKLLVNTAVAASLTLTGSVVPKIAFADGFEIEEVFVTARRKSESLQDVPIAVSSFSAEAMKAFNITRTEDLSAFTPGLSTEPHLVSNMSSLKVTMRGQVQAENLSTLDPSVGWYIDDVYLPRDNGTAGSLFDVAQVEVLKGPQGTLYGRNTTGGAIKLATTKADPSAGVEGYVTGGIGNFGAERYGAAINIPVVEDVFALRIAGLVDDVKDGWGTATEVRNPVAGLYPGNDIIDIPTRRRDVHVRDSEMLRIGATWKVSEDLLVTATYQHTEDSQNAILTNPNDVPLLGYTAPDDLFEDSAQNNIHESFAETKTVALNVEYQLNEDLYTRLIYGYRDVESEFVSDVDGSSLILNYFLEPFEQNSESTSIEWHLGGSADKLEWLVGLYYFEEEGFDFSSSNSGRLVGDGILGGTYGGIIDKNESNSAFVHGTYRFNDEWSMSAGLRYTEDEKPVLVNAETITLTGTECRFDLASNPNSDPATCTWSSSDTYEEMSWSLSLDWAFSSNAMAYIRSGSSFRAGGQNLRALGIAETTDAGGNVEIIDTSTPFDPETVTDVEIGLKGVFFDDSLQLNVAAYNMWYEDIQDTLLLDTPRGLTTFVTNRSDAVFQGLEVDAQWVVTESFMLSGTASIFSSDFDDEENAPDLDMPDNQYTFRANYRIPVEAGEVNFDLNYSYRSALLEDLKPFDLEAESVSLWGARAALDLDTGLNIALWGRNLTDEEYTLSPLVLDESLKLVTTGVGQPRTYGIEFTYSF